MKMIIAGSRSISKELANMCWDDFYETFEHDVSEYVTGCCPTGADQVPFMQRDTGRGIPIKEFHADWEKHGKAAGPIRNREMAEYADVLFIIWDGKSKGSKSMIREMEKLGKPIYGGIIKGDA